MDTKDPNYIDSGKNGPKSLSVISKKDWDEWKQEFKILKK